MASYILYTYQFAPIINDGANLFQPTPDIEQDTVPKSVSGEG